MYPPRPSCSSRVVYLSHSLGRQRASNRGDSIILPSDVWHPQATEFNHGHKNAVAIAGLNSQNPGVITVANAVCGSNPKIDECVLAKAFQLDKKLAKKLQHMNIILRKWNKEVFDRFNMLSNPDAYTKDRGKSKLGMNRKRRRKYDRMGIEFKKNELFEVVRASC
ncbi:putative germin-like protein 2-2 [Acorus calamus]|uniref:Germin-like protein 2-2 n=1 Tax=Acorus calamus TaxID=4465 RepID=A0AAV9DVC4_ACOCL|nr:putative germin-like protein 2-2 [Acorus calamus]